MDTQNKTGRAILKISKDTIDNKVIWKFGFKERITLGGEEEIIDNVYVADYHDRRLRLYHFRYKDYFDYLEYNWADNYRLEIIDASNNSLWVFPEDNAIVGLYDTVREKTTDVKGFFDDILKEE